MSMEKKLYGLDYDDTENLSMIIIMYVIFESFIDYSQCHGCINVVLITVVIVITIVFLKYRLFFRKCFHRKIAFTLLKIELS